MNLLQLFLSTRESLKLMRLVEMEQKVRIVAKTLLQMDK